MEIVRLQKEHCEILAELEKLCFSHPWSQRAIEDEVHNSNAYFVTAVDGDKILGYGGMHCTHQECYVDNIAVFGHHRKKGVGTAIVLALVHEAQRRGRSTSLWRCAPPTGRRWGCTPSWAFWRRAAAGTSTTTPPRTPLSSPGVSKRRARHDSIGH